jgi:5S rRNA maturation endonuclease (ribonuclease M5)
MIDTTKLKTIDAEVILNILGLPYRRTGDRIMATATYRDENTASISIQEKNGRYLWLDFGTGKGGSWIDLVMAIKDLNYIDAIMFLNNIENAEINNGSQEKRPLSSNRREDKQDKPNRIEITAITKITDDRLINYLRSRAISFIPDWLKQINYSVFKNSKAYLNSAVGIKNSAGGYAIRNPKIKMNIGKSAYSLFLNNSDIKNEIIFVTEGLFDGLTIAEKMGNRLYDLVVLNSIKNLNNKVIEILSSYKNIVLALDSDVPGKETENKIIRQIKNIPIHKLTFKAKDLNEAFVLKEKIGVAVCR